MASDDTWQISGGAAEKYERFVASWFRPWADDLVERAGVRAGDMVLDVACGTGVVTRAAAPVVGAHGSIQATDLNADMIAEARRQPIDVAPVVWREADATNLPFLAATFDVVLCQQGLQFVPDKTAAAKEMARVLRTGGVAAVSVWRSPEHNRYIAALADGLTRHVSADAGQTMLAPCGFGDPEALERLFVFAGFASTTVESVSIPREPTNAVEAIVGNLAALPIAAEIDALAPDAHARMIDDIVESLADVVVDGQLVVANSALVLLARC